MCCCGKPVINGQMGYKWQPNDTHGICPVSPPDLQADDVLLYDEPGRCGGLDSHYNHFRVVKHFGTMFLLVRHGGGDERTQLHFTTGMKETLAAQDSNARYWYLCLLYHAYKDGVRYASERVNREWQQAAAEKRIKTRKHRGVNAVKVWIEPSKS